jgi:hypothetical protein
MCADELAIICGATPDATATAAAAVQTCSSSNAETTGERLQQMFGSCNITATLYTQYAM